MVLGNNLQPLEEVCAGHCVSLKVIRLPSGKGLELTVLGLDFLDDFLQNHKVTAGFGGLPVGAAGSEFPFGGAQAGNVGRVCEGPAHTDVGVLAQAQGMAMQQPQAVDSSGHIGHDAHRAHQPGGYGSRNTVIYPFRVAEIIGANQQIFHGLNLFRHGISAPAVPGVLL